MKGWNLSKSYGIKKSVFIFLFGGFSYGALEIIWRGYTHFSMLILSGLLFLLMYLLESKLSRLFFPLRAIAYAFIITASEFLSGLYLNIFLRLDIWDYSDKQLNLLGQICLPYSLLWVAVSLLAVILIKLIKYSVITEEKCGKAD